MENRKRKNFHQDDLLDRAIDAVLHDPIPDEPSPQEVDRLVATVRAAAERPLPLTLMERTRKMKRIVKLAVAVSVLAAIGILAFWTTSGGSDHMAFARVADALDSLRSATFDLTSEAKCENGQSATATGKGFFLAPSHQRMEISMELSKISAIKAAEAAARRARKARGVETPEAKEAAKSALETIKHMDFPKMESIMISDSQTAKCINLNTLLKFAMIMDMKKNREDMAKAGNAYKPDMFEMVRHLVREESSITGGKVERMGKKEIDGREAVGFRVHTRHGLDWIDMKLWADPQTARPIRIEIVYDVMPDGHLVMNNFRYDVDLDPALFSMEIPEGYSTLTMEMKMPVEEDLLRTLRTIAEHNKGLFPEKLGMNVEVMKAINDAVNAAFKPEQDKLNADIAKLTEKITAKHGGEKKLKEKYGKNPSPALMEELMKETIKARTPLVTKQMPLIQKEMQGITFYTMLKPENDPHYIGGGVKLGTPDRPILWYKPTAAEKYRVIYADLSVKEVPAKELPKEPQAEDGSKATNEKAGVGSPGS